MKNYVGLIGLCLLLAAVGATPLPTEPPRVLDVGNQKQLLLDDYLIESSQGISLSEKMPK